MTATLPSYERRLSPATGVAIIAVVAVLGLLYVKWLPYYHRAFVAAATHSIGHSILMGSDAHAPAPSWKAAIDYSLAYGKAIWQAMVLGLLLGAAVQEFLPIAWMARSLGRSSWRGVAIGGLLAIPGMMCTCCAAPVVIGLRRRSASPAAATAFWLGNTVLNPAALIFIGFVLGWQWMGLRLALGIPLGVRHRIPDHPPDSARGGCRARGTVGEIASERRHRGPSIKGWFNRFFRLLIWLVPEYVILVLLLGATRAWIFPAVVRRSAMACNGSSSCPPPDCCSSSPRQEKCPSCRPCWPWASEPAPQERC